MRRNRPARRSPLLPDVANVGNPPVAVFSHLFAWQNATGLAVDNVSNRNGETRAARVARSVPFYAERNGIENAMS